MNCSCNLLSKDQLCLLDEINTLSFFVVDMTLYVDTHPNDSNACDSLIHYTSLLKDAKENFAKKYCPLTEIDGGFHSAMHSWECMPLPWEGGMN